MAEVTEAKTLKLYTSKTNIKIAISIIATKYILPTLINWNFTICVKDSTKCNIRIYHNSHNPNFCLVLFQRPFFIFFTNPSTSYWVAFDFKVISLHVKKLAISCKSSKLIEEGKRKIISFEVLSISIIWLFVNIIN